MSASSEYTNKYKQPCTPHHFPPSTPHISRPLQSIREVVPNRMQKPGVMATLNLFLEMPATPDGELQPIRSKASLGELLLFVW